MYNCDCYFCIYLYGLTLNGWRAVLCITNNRHDVTIATHAIKRHFLIWVTMSRQPTKRRCSCVLTLKYTFICVYWWTRQIIHNTLIVVNRYLRLMGDKTIADSAEPRLESFYPPFVAGIDLPHQGVVDSYNPPWVADIDLPQSRCCGFFVSFIHKSLFQHKKTAIISVVPPSSSSTSTSASKYFIHRHISNNHETETHEVLFASLFHGLSSHCKYFYFYWKSWLVHVHWNNKTCAWRSIYDWYYYCKYRLVTLTYY